MDDRTDFEEWYSQERPDMVNPFERVVSDERYVSMETEWAYRGYKEASKVPVVMTEELTYHLEQALDGLDWLLDEYPENWSPMDDEFKEDCEDLIERVRECIGEDDG